MTAQTPTPNSTAAVQAWEALDYIDTAGDAAKGNDELYAELVLRELDKPRTAANSPQAEELTYLLDKIRGLDPKVDEYRRRVREFHRLRFHVFTSDGHGLFGGQTGTQIQ